MCSLFCKLSTVSRSFLTKKIDQIPSVIKLINSAKTKGNEFFLLLFLIANKFNKFEQFGF